MCDCIPDSGNTPYKQLIKEITVVPAYQGSRETWDVYYKKLALRKRQPKNSGSAQQPLVPVRRWSTGKPLF